MDFRLESRRQRQALAENALAIARELEAGRAHSPFQDKLGEAAVADPSLPVRAAILAASPDTTHALLSEIVGHDYNVCKVVVPSRLGFSEILLQERGFLLDTGAGPKEFDDVGSFVSALQDTPVLAGRDDAALEPLRFKLKGPAHLSGLCLLIPHSLDAVQRRPALLSTLSDQADWVFLAGDEHTRISADHRQTIQVVLEQVTGLQNVLVPSADQVNGTATDEWWKGWKVTLSLGLVRHGTDLLRTRLALLTAPQSELRHYLVERRLLRQLETTLVLMDEELQQAQRLLANRQTLARENLLGEGSSASRVRRSAEVVRTRLSDDAENLLRAIDRENKAALAPDGAIGRVLREAAQQLTVDDIEQTPADLVIKLTLHEPTAQRLTTTVAKLINDRLAADLRQVREGLEISLRDTESALEAAVGVRPKLSLELPDEASLRLHTRPEVRYRGEMPRPTLMTRLQAARQGIMSLMIAGSVLGGAAALVDDDGGGSSVRTYLYAAMLPLLIVGFLWTYVSFRKKELRLLEKELEKLQDGVLQELRRVVHDGFREQQNALSTAAQKAIRQAQQQLAGTIEQLEEQRQRETEDAAKRQAAQQRTLDQRLARLRQVAQQLASFTPRLTEAKKFQHQWLNDWIARFNQQKT